ncbi:MAG: SDR family NAD(P)-dependent oxidoreductase [Rhodospirillales bacterium]|nr:SDR family NAD(P)-dependent oxidoreductase [Rhodospirillales bacterium]
MDLKLDGKTAIVTGGTRGIGHASARRLAREGCRVGICARGAAGLDGALAAFAAEGLSVIGAVCDVADGEAVKQWTATMAAELGGIDIVVANPSALVGATDEAAWRAGLEIDVLGTVRTVEAAMPHLEKSDAAAIVTISSVAGLESFGGVRPYNSVKAALINYTSNLANALAGQGIRVNCVSPGTIFFEGGVWDQRRLDDPEVYEWALSRNPTGRMGTAEEVADAVAFLASPLSGFTTGTNLVVDGGITQRVQY